MKGDGRTKYRRNRDEAFLYLQSGLKQIDAVDVPEETIYEFIDNECRSRKVCANCGGMLGDYQGNFKHLAAGCEANGKHVKLISYYWVDFEDIRELEMYYLNKCEYCGEQGKHCRLFGFDQILCPKCKKRQSAKMKKWRELRSMMHEEMLLVQIEVHNMALKEIAKANR